MSIHFPEIKPIYVDLNYTKPEIWLRLSTTLQTTDIASVVNTFETKGLTLKEDDDLFGPNNEMSCTIPMDIQETSPPRLGQTGLFPLTLTVECYRMKDVQNAFIVRICNKSRLSVDHTSLTAALNRVKMSLVSVQLSKHPTSML